MLNYEFPPLGGGASPVSYELAKGYVKLGHKVDVVTMHYKDLPFHEVKDGINIYRVRCIRKKKEMCTTPEMLSYVISAKHFLKKHLKTNSYDINHTHFIIPTGIVALWAKKKFNLPYIITSHGSDVLGYNKRFDKVYPLIAKKWKEIIKEAKVTVTPSKFLQGEIKKHTQEGNFQVISNGIDSDKFKPMKKQKKILVVARLFPNKGVQDILDALKYMDLKDWKVDIVGEGPYRQFLENKAKENNLNDKVIFHGWVDNNSEKMKHLYGHASIFISASYFESFGITILEALSAGCYPLISDIPTHREFVNKGSLFNNVYQLREKISQFLKLKNIYAQKVNPSFKNSINKYINYIK
jgi:glycosyltransferase involved in cell wall biosynthesis